MCSAMSRCAANTRAHVHASKRLTQTEALKLNVPVFSRKTVDEAKDSLYLFHGLLESLGLLPAAYGAPYGVGTADDDAILSTLVRRFIQGDREVVTHLRTTLGEVGVSGQAKFAALRQTFVDPLVNENADAEAQLAKFDYNKLWNGDGQKLTSGLNELWAITTRLPESRRGNAAYWVDHVLDRVPEDLHRAYDRYMRQQSAAVNLQVTANAQMFGRALGKALNALRRRDGRGSAFPAIKENELPQLQRHGDDPGKDQKKKKCQNSKTKRLPANKTSTETRRSAERHSKRSE